MDWFPTRQFDDSRVSGFNADYYLGQQGASGVRNTWDSMGVGSGGGNIYWADYVRGQADVEQAWQNQRQSGGSLDRWDYGKWHFDTHGVNESGRLMPLIVQGGRGQPGNTKTIWSKYTGAGGDAGKIARLNAYNEEAFKDYAAYHYETQGKGQGLFKNEMDFYNSPGEQDRRAQEAAAEQRAFEQELERQRQAAAAEATRVAQAAAAQRSRTGGSSPVGTGGSADFRGSRLSITKPGGRKGASIFSRGPSLQYNPQMAIAGNNAGASLQKKNLNV